MEIVWGNSRTFMIEDIEMIFQESNCSIHICVLRVEFK